MTQTPFRKKLIALIATGLMLPAAVGAQTLTKQFPFEDYLLVPVRVHLLSAKEFPAIQTTLTETDITRIWKKVNAVWSQAGLHFYIESLVEEDAKLPEADTRLAPKVDGKALLDLRPAPSQSDNLFHVYYLKDMSANGIYFVQAIFVKDTASLRRVEGGIDEPLPRVTSHELGHGLTLSHRQNTTNLMASGTTGTWLNEGEIEQARKAARSLQWIVAAPDVMKQAEEKFQASRFKEAATLYSRLATLPLKSEEVERAKMRAEKTSQ